MTIDAKKVLNDIIYLSGFSGIIGPIEGSMMLFEDKLSFINNKEEVVFDLSLSKISNSYYQSRVEEIIGKPVAFGLGPAYFKKIIYQLVISNKHNDCSVVEVIFETGTVKDEKFLEMINNSKNNNR